MSGIFVLTIGASEAENILEYQSVMGGLDWSYSQSTLLVSLLEERRPRLFSLFTTNGPSDLSTTEVDNFDGTPTWSPKEDWIAYRGYDSETDSIQIFRVRPDGSSREKVSNITGCYPSDPDWFSFSSE